MIYQPKLSYCLSAVSANVKTNSLAKENDLSETSHYCTSGGVHRGVPRAPLYVPSAQDKKKY